MPKTLIPSLRERNRYIAFELTSEGKLPREDVVGGMWSSLLSSLGTLGASKTGFWFMDWIPEKSVGVIKVNHGSVEDVRAALALAANIKGKPVVFHVLGVSGTLKKAREKYVKN